jgi:hypothetical protein
MRSAAGPGRQQEYFADAAPFAQRMGSRNLPSRTSSANSRSLEGSGCPNTRFTLMPGFLSAVPSGSTEAKPKLPPCFTFANSFAAVSPPTVSATASTGSNLLSASSSSIATTPHEPKPRASSSWRVRTPAITRAPSFFALWTAARPTLPSAPVTTIVCPLCTAAA